MGATPAETSSTHPRDHHHRRPDWCRSPRGAHSQTRRDPPAVAVATVPNGSATCRGSTSTTNPLLLSLRLYGMIAFFDSSASRVFFVLFRFVYSGTHFVYILVRFATHKFSCVCVGVFLEMSCVCVYACERTRIDGNNRNENKKEKHKKKKKKKAKNALKSELDGWTVPVRRAERVAPKIKLNVKRKN